MSFNEIQTGAESGDVKAMDALGRHYLNVNNYVEAWEWFDKAAGQGYMPSVVNAALVGPLVSYSRFKAVGLSDVTSLDWMKTYKYSLLAINDSNIPSDTKRSIQEKLPMILYYIGYCRYFSDDISSARKYLEYDEALGDPKCSVLLGICYSDLGVQNQSGELLKKAIPLLQMIDKTECDEDSVVYLAYMQLSFIYRLADDLGVPGIKTDITTAHDYVFKAVKRSGNLAGSAQKELNKYQKKILGGYKYID